MLNCGVFRNLAWSMRSSSKWLRSICQSKITQQKLCRIRFALKEKDSNHFADCKSAETTHEVYSYSTANPFTLTYGTLTGLLSFDTRIASAEHLPAKPFR